MSNLFDKAREHIPPAERTEAVFQCIFCGYRKGYTAFDVRSDGKRNEYCRDCKQYEQDEGGEHDRQEDEQS